MLWDICGNAVEYRAYCGDSMRVGICVGVYGNSRRYDGLIVPRNTVVFLSETFCGFV